MNLIFDEQEFDFEGRRSLLLPTSDDAVLQRLMVGRYVLMVTCDLEGELQLVSLLDEISVADYLKLNIEIDDLNFVRHGLYEIIGKEIPQENLSVEQVELED